jgi:hypothetical protein
MLSDSFLANVDNVLLEQGLHFARIMVAVSGMQQAAASGRMQDAVAGRSPWQIQCFEQLSSRQSPKNCQHFASRVLSEVNAPSVLFICNLRFYRILHLEPAVGLEPTTC